MYLPIGYSNPVLHAFSVLSPILVFVPNEACVYAQSVRISGAEGYIASGTTEETRCGSAVSPWLIQVAESQRINITLMDFSYRYLNFGGSGLYPCCAFRDESYIVQHVVI